MENIRSSKTTALQFFLECLTLAVDLKYQKLNNISLEIDDNCYAYVVFLTNNIDQHFDLLVMD
jgi:hypothetical protein